MQGFKVAVLGAAGGIGQPLSLLMKLNPLVGALSLYDIAGTPGVAADISHINTPPLVGSTFAAPGSFDRSCAQYVELLLSACA